MEYLKEQISFSVNGNILNGVIVRPELDGVYPAVIFFHGLSSNESGHIIYAEHVAREGMVGMTFNLRGHGNSEGNFSELTVRDAVKDGLAAYDKLCSYEFVDRTKIGLCGSSVGGAIVSLVAQQRPVQSLLLRVPATYTEEMMDMTYDKIMEKEKGIFTDLTDFKNTESLKAISQFSGNLFVVESGNDDIIPVTIPEGYFNLAGKVKYKEKEVMQGAPHSLSKTPEFKNYFAKISAEWFKKTLW